MDVKFERFYAVFRVGLVGDEDVDGSATMLEHVFDTILTARNYAENRAKEDVGARFAVLTPADYPNLYYCEPQEPILNRDLMAWPEPPAKPEPEAEAVLPPVEIYDPKI